MKKLILILMLFIVPSALAELQITPNSYDQVVYVNQEKKLELTLKNTFDFIIYNINMTHVDDVTFPLISSLGVNETKKINLSVNVDETYDKKTFNSVLKFWYYSQINLDPVTYDINITDVNFTPSEITIRIGDQIRFNNRGSVFASIKDDYSPYKYFDKEIQVNQSVTVNTFSIMDNFDYTDWNIWKKGRIIVQNVSQELINNPDYNKGITISLTSRYLESKLGIEIYPHENISMEYNEFQELNARVWNDGNQTIHNVRFTTSSKPGWFSFEENNFDLTKGQNRFIKVRITPEINETEETNKTYNINIKAEADNAESSSTTLRIFIPFAEEIHRIYYGEDFWKAREEFCEKFPTAIECNPPPKIEYREKIIIKNSTIEYSKEEALKNDREQNKRLSTIEGLQEKQTKSVNLVTDTVSKLNNLLQSLRTQLNTSNTIAEKARKKSENSELNFFLTIFLLIIIAGGGIFYVYTKKQVKIKVRQEHP